MGEFVPLFPLPNVVLLPRAVLPLHIFEERYRAMTADALAGDGQIAMALLAPGWEKNYHGNPPIEPVVCVGKILQHEQLADGRYNFLLQGMSRCRVEREERVGLYRAAEVTSIEDESVLEIDLIPLRHKLQLLFKDPLASLPLADQFCELLQTIIPTADAADVIAFHILTDLREKQILLEEGDARVRVRRLIDQLDYLARSLSSTSTENHMGRRFGLN